MTGCSAGYCTNSSAKGFQMCRLPRVEKRRRIWIENMDRPDWEPSPNSSLCEVHFTNDMWESTREGKRRLKSDAIPIIFSNQSGTKQDKQFSNANTEKMPTCAVEGCMNSSKKKFKMNSLPCNPVQQTLWMKNIDRPNWVPKKNAAVCEIHFAPEMWEKTRVDGTRKLKCNAVPTIFDNQTVKESPKVQTKILPERNQNDVNVLISNKQTIIQILSPTNRLNLQQSPLVIPAITVSSVNSKSLSNNSKRISILKPKIKMNKTLILSNTNTLTNKKIINRDQKTIIISRNSDSSKVKPIDLSPSLPINDFNVPEVTEVETDSCHSVLNSTTVDQVINLNGTISIPNVGIADVTKADDNQSELIPMMVDTSNNTNFMKTQAIDLTESLPMTNRNASNVTETQISGRQLIPLTEDSNNLKTQVINLEKHHKFKSKISNVAVITNIEKLTTAPSTISERLESTNQLKSEEFVSPGIILNKTEAKKREDERFEKMDKLLLKQLKLNDALRKKLIVLRRRIQSLMKNQDQKQDLGPMLFLKKVFTEDQIRVLQSRYLNSKSITTWSDETMLKAIKLKKACGLCGYEEILNQNLPYPSFKTITRWCLERHIEIP